MGPLQSAAPLLCVCWPRYFPTGCSATALHALQRVEETLVAARPSDPGARAPLALGASGGGSLAMRSTSAITRAERAAPISCGA
jgi:hypothetical protein